MACLGGDMIVEWNWDKGSRYEERMNIESTLGIFHEDDGLEPMIID
jgi:hypothetical protein